MYWQIFNVSCIGQEHNELAGVVFDTTKLLNKFIYFNTCIHEWEFIYSYTIFDMDLVDFI